MELTVQLEKLTKHYEGVQALMLETTNIHEFIGIQKELDTLEYQMDILKLRIGESHDGNGAG